MRSKAPLVLMEQMVMLLVFALAAALCMQAFVKSDQLSQQIVDRDQAVSLCQNAAEAIRASKGNFAQAAKLLGADTYDSDSLMVDYAKDWTPAEDTMGYTLGVTRLEEDQPGLGRAAVWLRDEQEETELFRLEAAWQEVSIHGS